MDPMEQIALERLRDHRKLLPRRQTSVKKKKKKKKFSFQGDIFGDFRVLIFSDSLIKLV